MKSDIFCILDQNFDILEDVPTVSHGSMAGMLPLRKDGQIQDFIKLRVRVTMKYQHAVHSCTCATFIFPLNFGGPWDPTCLDPPLQVMVYRLCHISCGLGAGVGVGGGGCICA